MKHFFIAWQVIAISKARRDSLVKDFVSYMGIVFSAVYGREDVIRLAENGDIAVRMALPGRSRRSGGMPEDEMMSFFRALGSLVRGLKGCIFQKPWMLEKTQFAFLGAIEQLNRRKLNAGKRQIAFTGAIERVAL